MNLRPEKRKSWRDLHEENKKRKEKKLLKRLDLLEEKKKEKTEKKLKETEIKKLPDIITCGIAIPSSILDNAQTEELKSYVAGQIARSACIYRINEIIIFDDSKGDNEETSKTCLKFARILQYLECPQYLRKHIFPIHRDFQHVGLINPLDAPHHLRKSEESEYREGITTRLTKKGYGCYVNVGLERNVKVTETIEPGFRVTVRLEPKTTESNEKNYGTVVSPEEPCRAIKRYWGYSVRIAHTLSQIFTKCPYETGYDYTIGTSDKGVDVKNLPDKEYKHCLIVFGGLKGLESALKSDKELNEENPQVLFDYYINTCPGQGSRTIRTEEAVVITLAELRNKVLDLRWT